MTGKYQTETPLATNGSASPGASLAPPIINKEPTADHDAEVVALTPSSSGFQRMSEIASRALEWTVPGLIPKGEPRAQEML